MGWLKKVGSFILISQLLIGYGSYVVSASTMKISSEEENKNDNFLHATSDKFLVSPERMGSNEMGSIDNAINEGEELPEETSEQRITEDSSSESKDERTETSNERAIEDSKDSLLLQKRNVQAVGSGLSVEDPRIVENSSELRTAIEQDKVPYIKLADSSSIFQFEKNTGGRIKISYNVTIDGNGRTLSYSDNGNYYAMQVSSSNLTVKFKNMTFGSPDFSVSAYDWYGFCYGDGNSNTTIAVENVHYYSKSAAQPFHNNGAGSKIIFSGNNHFSVQQGSYSQEFAECNHFVFEEDSHTTIDHNTGHITSIGTSGNNFTFELQSGAVVDYSTTSRFVDNYSGRGNITVANGAQLKINGSSSFINLSRPIDVLVSEAGKLNLAFANEFNFSSASTFNLANDSTLDMAVLSDGRLFSSSIAASNFIIDNAYRLSFSVSKSANREPVNAGFTFKDFVRDVTGYGLTADNQPINTTIANKDIITTDGSNFTLRNTISERADFTTEEKSKIRSSKSIVLQRLPNPTVILKVNQVIRDTSATFNLSEYLTNQNTINGAVFKLFEKKQKTDNFESALAEKKVPGSLTVPVDFDNLTPEKNYWLYVQIEAGFETGNSEWYEVPFTTKSSVLSVSIPTAMFFNTEMTQEKYLAIYSPSYGIKNNSAYPVNVAIDSFTEKGNSGITLLDSAELRPTNGLLLQLTKNHETPTTLTTDMTNFQMGELAIGEQATLRFTGEYFGSAGKEINVNYTMTLNFKKVGE